MDACFLIGPFPFRLRCPEEVVPPPDFLRFAADQISPQFTYHIHTVDHLPSPDGTILTRRPDLVVYQSPQGERRLLGVKGQSSFYGLYQETGSQTAQVFLDAHRIGSLHIDPVFSSLLALERRMVARNSLIFHCAYLRHQGEAILFSAPSGVGKSTQAGLWERYRGSEVINGDRALLSKHDGRWTAFGWPVSGTSGVCNNLSTPIRAIVMLSQSPHNHAAPLSGLAALRALYAQTTVNYWNADAVAKTLDLLEDLLGQIPVYHLACDISEDAVQCLQTALEQPPNL